MNVVLIIIIEHWKSTRINQDILLSMNLEEVIALGDTGQNQVEILSSSSRMLHVNINLQILFWFLFSNSNSMLDSYNSG